MKQTAFTSDSQLFGIFQKGEYLSVKFSAYFHAYEAEFAKYVGKPVTFVEVGVLHGGSLFMWREYLGPQARIIGVDLSPGAKKWDQHGFEIYIGDQGDPSFWKGFFEKVGPIDVLLDDGGHTNTHQIVTVDSAIAHINDGGVILIEDVNTSYMSRFGNPSRFSFINYAKRAIDAINSRGPELKPIDNAFRRRVSSITFYESMVAFHIDDRNAALSQIVTNSGKETGAQDMRALSAMSGIESYARGRMAFLKDVPVAMRVAKFAFPMLRSLKQRWSNLKERRSLAKYFQ